MNLKNYILQLPENELIKLHVAALNAGGICGTISALQILTYFGIEIKAQEVKEGLKDSLNGTNQVNMAVFMSKYLHVTFCVNYDIKSEILKGENSDRIHPNDISEFQRLLNGKIEFNITPPMDILISSLNNTSLAQFNFKEPNIPLNHFGLLHSVENNMLKFTQRDCKQGNELVKIEDFISWWDLNGEDRDPEQLVILYKKY